MAGPGSILDEFVAAVSHEEFRRFTIFGRPFTVERLTLDRFKGRFTHIPSVFSNAELTNLLVACYGFTRTV